MGAHDAYYASLVGEGLTNLYSTHVLYYGITVCCSLHTCECTCARACTHTRSHTQTQTQTHTHTNTHAHKHTQALVASFQKWQSGEVPVKRRDMDTLSDLYTQLNKPRKQRSPVSPAVPTDLTFPPLELDWTYLTTESKLYNSALQEELQRYVT